MLSWGVGQENKTQGRSKENAVLPAYSFHLREHGSWENTTGFVCAGEVWDSVVLGFVFMFAF